MQRNQDAELWQREDNRKKEGLRETVDELGEQSVIDCFSCQLIFVWLVIRNFVPCIFVSDCNQMITHRQKKQQNNRSMCNLFKDT